MTAAWASSSPQDSGAAYPLGSPRNILCTCSFLLPSVAFGVILSPLTSLATSTNPLSLFQTDKQQLLPPGPLLLGFVPDLPQGELVVVRLALHLVPAGGQPLPPAQHLVLVQPLQPGCPARPGPAYQGTQCVPPAPAVLALQRHQLPLTLHLQHDLPDARHLPRPSAQVVSPVRQPHLHLLPADVLPHHQQEGLQLAASAAALPRGLHRLRPRLQPPQPAHLHRRLRAVLLAAQVVPAAPLVSHLPVPAAAADPPRVGPLPVLRRASLQVRPAAQVHAGQPLVPADPLLPAEHLPVPDAAALLPPPPCQHRIPRSQVCGRHWETH